MRYFENPNDGNKVYGYDSMDETQGDLLQKAIAEGWVEVTSNWPPAPAAAELAAAARADRDARIAAVAWRYERHARELRLGLTPTDNLAALDAYVQALADVPLQAGFPSTIDWPVAP